MSHDRIATPSVQAQPMLAHTLRTHLVHFLRPLAQRLAAQLDIRLVQTALDLVQLILTHRHRARGLLLTELGGYLLSPAQAPAGAKRISNLIHCPDWSADDLNGLLSQQATERVQALCQADEEVLLVWDGSVWEKPESQANSDWCVVRSAKARRLSRRRKGMTIPHKGPPILAHMEWWTTRGERATTQRVVENSDGALSSPKVAIVSWSAEVSLSSASVSWARGPHLDDRALGEELLRAGHQGDPAEHVGRCGACHGGSLSRPADSGPESHVTKGPGPEVLRPVPQSTPMDQHQSWTSSRPPR